MISKIISHHGVGSADLAIKYIAGEINHKGKKRDDVIHLFGDGQQVIDISESMTCKHRYLSSVLSFTKEESERLSIDEIIDLAESFAKHHAEPLGSNAIAGCAYLHVEGGRYDVHIIQTQLDLESGKRVDLYLDNCGDTARIAAWQDCKNYEMNLDNPRDPSRQRLTNNKIRETKGRAEMRALVNEHLTQKTIDGAIKSRSDVIAELQNIGFEISRKNATSISIKSSDMKQNIRLKGGLYHESFRGIETIKEAISNSQRRDQSDHREQYESARSRLEESNKKRTKRISKKLKIDLSERTQGLHFSNQEKTNADLDSIVFELSSARRNRLMGSPDNQRSNEGNGTDQLLNNAVQQSQLRSGSTIERITNKGWELPHQTKLMERNNESTDNQIPNNSTHDERNENHAKTMQRLSKVRERLNSTSQRLDRFNSSRGCAGFEAGGAINTAIKGIAEYVAKAALMLKNTLLRKGSNNRMPEKPPRLNLLP